LFSIRKSRFRFTLWRGTGMSMSRCVVMKDTDLAADRRLEA
jgi:hypothetical protein